VLQIIISINELVSKLGVREKLKNGDYEESRKMKWIQTCDPRDRKASHRDVFAEISMSQDHT